MSSLSTTSSRYRQRKMVDRIMTGIAYACTAVAILPLTWIIIYVVIKGLGAWDLNFFTALPQSFGDGGGVRNGIVGTLVIVGLATLIGVPVGVMAGIYLAEYGNNRLGYVIRFMADTMTGIPSIVVGLFAFGLVVGITGGFSALAGAFALAVLMIPVITRTTEEIIRLVPGSIREASLGLGVSRWKTIMRVVVPTALSGIVTGVLLAVARVAGETAPLILTIFGTNFPLSSNLVNAPYTTLSLQIYQLGKAPSPDVVEVAWGAAMLLVIIVVGTSILARLIFKGQNVSGR
ncbi:MAG TPA: phosphate ABC transporter permease PstA [Rubrobacteraceae bacterium]|nr:phosphate ABC transporter permease PstA [Rubrobacteraceae bacterium]